MFFTRERRKRTADILMHVGNILFTASVAGKLIPGVSDRIDAMELAVGLMFTIAAWGMSVRLSPQKEGDEAS